MLKEDFDNLSVEEQCAWGAGNFPDFCRYALGYSDMNDIHNEICLILQFDANLSKMFLLPRNSFKSSIITCGYSLFSLVHDPNMRILIYSDSAGKASGFLRDIKNHIEGTARNSLFRKLYGEWETTPQVGKWNDSQVIISVRKESRKEPSIDTGGIETSKVGQHYDMIIFDDIVTDINTTTKAQMDKVYECYQKSLSLLKPGGKIIIVGTRWSFGDAYGRIIDENKENPTFKIVIKRAYDDEDFHRVYHFADCGSESLTASFLEDKRAKLGLQYFSCLYLNDPASGEDAVFKSSNFNFYQDIETDKLYKICTVDPAGEGEDFTAMIVCGYDNDMKMYILEAVNEHLKPSQIVERVIELSYRWQFSKMGIETNMYQGMLEEDILKAINEERENKNFQDFSVELLTSTRKEGKHARIMSLEPIHARKEILFKGRSLDGLRGSFQELADQMLKYTYAGAKTPHDDLVDALAFQVKLMRRGGSVEEVSAPKGSLAWHEEREYEAALRLNKRMPRFLRKRPQFSFLG